MAENAFSVQVPDIYSALMAGEQSYKDTRTQVVRNQAAQSIQQGGDPREAIGKLLGVGDTQGANTLASLIAQKNQQDYQNRSLDATISHNQAELGLQKQQLGATVANNNAMRAEQSSHDRATEGIARDTLEAGKVQTVVDPLTGSVRIIRVGPHGYTDLTPAQPSGAGQPAPQNPAQSMQPGAVTQPAPIGAVPQPGMSPQPTPGVVPPPGAAPNALPGAPPTSGANPDNVTAVMQKYGGKPNDGKNWAYLASLPESAQIKLLGLTNYELNPSNYSTRIAPGAGMSARDAATTAASKFDNTYNQQDYPNIQRAKQAFMTGPQGNNVRSLNVVVDHAGTLRELGMAMQNGNIPLFNSIAQKWAQETGNPAPTNLNMAKQIVGSELVKAMGVAGAGTEGERAELGQSISTASSPAQIVGAIDNVVRPLLGGQLRGLRQQFVSSTRQPESKFNDMLFPTTRAFLDTKAGQSGGGSAGADGGNVTKNGVSWKVVQ